MYKIKTYVPVAVDYGEYDLHQPNYHHSELPLHAAPPAARAAAATTTAPDAQLPYIIALHLYAGAPPPASTSHITSLYLSTRGGGGAGETRSLYGEGSRPAFRSYSNILRQHILCPPFPHNLHRVV